MKAVILAGGLGSRLAPLTHIIPKPLLPIGEKAVLELQILNLAHHGFREIFIATNYMAEYVEAFLGNGDRYGVQLHFSKEEQRLGTCGPVTLLREHLQETFLLMNGDILTRLNFAAAADFAESLDADLTVVTKEIITPFQFGKVLGTGNYIEGVQEKPDMRFEILAGMYFLKPALFDLIPHNTFFNIDALIRMLLAGKRKVGKYLCQEYWLDIGQLHDYDTAQKDYDTHFRHLGVQSTAGA